MKYTTLSLQTRLLWAAGVLLLAFLGTAGFALDRAFTQSAKQAMQDRLQGYLWSYLSGSDITVGGKLIAPETAPEPRFDRPLSGLYARIAGEKIRWDSPSSIGYELPFESLLDPNQNRFEGPIQSEAGSIYVMAQGVAWVVPNLGEIRLTFYIAETDAELRRQVGVFRATLSTYLGMLAAILLLVLVLLLRWGLIPLRRVAADLSAIEAGEKSQLDQNYAPELQHLTASLNNFIEGEREQRTRYRNTLGDLAHSLKTPLTVLRNELESGTVGDSLRTLVANQVERMDEIVAYQLSRAVTTGHFTLATPITVLDRAEQIVLSLEKVHRAKGVLCEFDIDESAKFYGENGDLMELLGNLLENAFKWCSHRVVLSVKTLSDPHARRVGLSIRVEDDGPGIAPDKVESVIKRGVRGDERVQGHGIGLAIVNDIVEAYRGKLRIFHSSELGGAAFEIRFEPLI